jgi:hypothetical protein
MENVWLKMDDFPIKQGKFKVGVVPADGWCSFAMSAGANSMNFWPI